MRSRSRSRFPDLWLNLFFAYVAAVTLAGGVAVARERQPWIIGDWLINYQGGFVRRGFAGEIAWLLGRVTHLSPVVFAAIFFLILYASFFWAFRDITLATSRNPWIVALIVSPAALSFQVLHRNTGYRKEVIFLAGLALFLALLRKTSLSANAAIAYMTVLLVVCTLSHEGLIFYAPYLFAALVVSGRAPLAAAKECLFPFVSGLAVFLICYRHLGSPETVTQICSSLGYKFAPVAGAMQMCADGAIPYLAKSRAAASDETVSTILHFQYLTIFPCFALLALLPAIGESFVLRRVGLRREVLLIWLTAAVSFAGTIILFRFSIDWGRWIYIHVVAITLLLMLVDAKRLDTPETDTPETDTPEAERGRAWKIVCVALVFVYATFWVLPADTDTLRLGYAQRVLEKAHIISKPVSGDRMPVD